MTSPPSYHGYRFPPEIISHAVWLYHRFCLVDQDGDVIDDGIRVIEGSVRPLLVNLTVSMILLPVGVAR